MPNANSPSTWFVYSCNFVCLRNITFPLSDISVGVGDQFLGVGQHRTSTKLCNVLIPSDMTNIAKEKRHFLIGKPSINGPSIPWLC